MTDEERDSRLYDVVHDVTRARHAQRQCGNGQIRLEVQSMPNFEFLKSDHY